MKKEDYSYYTYKVGRYKKFFFGDKENFIPYKEDTKHLVWNVMTEEGVYNIFHHYSFRKDLIKIKKKNGNNFIDFAEEVRLELSYRFWAKCEWEIDVCDIFHAVDRETLAECQKEFDENPDQVRVCVPVAGKKVDVYTQVMLNWDRFIHYLWDNKRKITKKGLGLE